MRKRIGVALMVGAMTGAVLTALVVLAMVATTHPWVGGPALGTAVLMLIGYALASDDKQ